MSFSRESYPGNGGSVIRFIPTGVNRYKVINDPTSRCLGMVERVKLRGYKIPRWAIVGKNGITGAAIYPTRSEASVELYRQETGRSLSYVRGGKIP